jgi:hypothetical protein
MEKRVATVYAYAENLLRQMRGFPDSRWCSSVEAAGGLVGGRFANIISRALCS